ncbi:MAG: arginine--tRNA ligase, partial [Treponema sp.]|nr:arginine--tRNA ligase [Treponema sp.]
MADQKESFRALVQAAIEQFKAEKSIEGDLDASSLVRVENPPKPEMGDLGVPLFPFAKAFRMAPPAIAAEVAKIINAGSADVKSLGTVAAVGPYVNIKLNKENAAGGILQKILKEGDEYGSFAE